MTQIQYAETGSGYPLVLLHGFCEDSTLWNKLVPDLSSQYRVLCPDLPGFGKSPSLLTPFSIEDIALELNNWLKEIKIESCIMIGHSLGGYIALAYADQFLSHLNGLGLFHSSALKDDPEKIKSRNQVIKFVRKHGSEKFLTAFGSTLFNEDRIEHLSSELDEYMNMIKASNSASIIGYTLAMRDRKERLKMLHDIAIPVLFIAGRKDQAVPFDSSMDQISRNTENIIFQILDYSAHLGMLEEPEISKKFILDYCEKCV